jgi:hypothetical protein
MVLETILLVIDLVKRFRVELELDEHTDDCAALLLVPLVCVEPFAWWLFDSFFDVILIYLANLLIQYSYNCEYEIKSTL